MTRVPGGVRTPALLALLALGACDRDGTGPAVEVTIPSGASFRSVTDSLVARDLIGSPLLFRTWARLRKDDARVRAGRYVFRQGDGWPQILDALVAGRVATTSVTIPEGFTLVQMAERLAPVAGLSADSVRATLSDPTAHERWDVPGPGLEGYLFPNTYRFAEGVPLEEILRTMTDAYRAYWTPQRRRRLDGLELSEREVVTLASIVQAEARVVDEMPSIASVYHNRVRRDWPLEADPTVLYALGGHRERLLFAAIDSVADNPYNTYRNPGIPPGPIGAPGAAALDATLQPAEEPYMFFVASPDGRHVFSRTLAEHNRAIARVRRERSRGSGG